MPISQRHNVFVSFDYDNDLDLKNMIIAQSRLSDSPFDISDFSMKEAAPQRYWRGEARTRIERCSVVLVLCGENTRRAKGVSEEIKIAQELGKPYFLIRGYPDRRCERPAVVPRTKMYAWTWENLKEIVNNPRTFNSRRPMMPQPVSKRSRSFGSNKPDRTRRRSTRGARIVR